MFLCFSALYSSHSCNFDERGTRARATKSQVRWSRERAKSASEVRKSHHGDSVRFDVLPAWLLGMGIGRSAVGVRARPSRAGWRGVVAAWGALVYVTHFVLFSLVLSALGLYSVLVV